MESNIPKYDLPVDYIVGEGFAKDLLKSYKNFPCKIESGLFILCIKGTMEVTINTNTHHISENDLITLPPNCILEVHTFSSDIQIYYAGFSSHFIESINLMKATQHLLPVIMENPIVALSPLQACSYKMFYESSILSYASLRTRENKEIVKAVLTMFIQGATEIYKVQNNWYLSSQSRKKEILLNPKDRAIFFTGSSVDFKRDLASIKMTEAITSNGVFQIGRASCRERV